MPARPNEKVPERIPLAVHIRAPRRRHDRRHRGGAWKVAYADFVTALMALFIVLWIVNGTARVRQSVSGYFQDPRGYTRKLDAAPPRQDETPPGNRANAADLQKQLEAALKRLPDFEALRKNIKFSITAEGLRIDLMENEQGLFFVAGRAEPTSAGERLLGVLAAEIGKLPNPVVIEGHTDALPFCNVEPTRGYGNWELSADRANAARRLLHGGGVRPQQVAEVRGFADQKLLADYAPTDPRNRRISLVVKFAGESTDRGTRVVN
jgi:chemotaxis protein MotB